MTFDKDFWEEHWRQRTTGSGMEGSPPNPYLVRGAGSLTPGTALDAGCGAGAEAIWLASQGWEVTAADISADALQRASRRATDGGVSQQVQWVEADLTVWSPDTQYALVTTHYAHPAMGQLAFYKRISNWVAPGGTLLIVGHQQHHGQHHPAEATIAVADIVAMLDATSWEIVTAEEHHRALPGRADHAGTAGHAGELRDVVVQAVRRRAA